MFLCPPVNSTVRAQKLKPHPTISKHLTLLIMALKDSSCEFSTAVLSDYSSTN